VRSALAANADVILVAKPDDDELCEIASRAAHSALLLIETPGRGCMPVLERVLSTAAARGESKVLAEVFSAIVALDLLPKKAGGRVAVTEIMLASPALKAALREGKPGALAKLPEPFGPGSLTLEAAKLELRRQGLIDARLG